MYPWGRFRRDHDLTPLIADATDRGPKKRGPSLSLLVGHVHRYDVGPDSNTHPGELRRDVTDCPMHKQPVRLPKDHPSFPTLHCLELSIPESNVSLTAVLRGLKPPWDVDGVLIKQQASPKAWGSSPNRILILDYFLDRKWPKASPCPGRNLNRSGPHVRLYATARKRSRLTSRLGLHPMSTMTKYIGDVSHLSWSRRLSSYQGSGIASVDSRLNRNTELCPVYC